MIAVCMYVCRKNFGGEGNSSTCAPITGQIQSYRLISNNNPAISTQNKSKFMCELLEKWMNWKTKYFYNGNEFRLGISMAIVVFSEISSQPASEI